jgi:hypothetical protein
MRLSVVAAPLVLTLAGALGACASTPPNSESDQSRVRVQSGDLGRTMALDVDTRHRAATVDADVPLTAVAAFDALPDVYRRLGITQVAVVDTSGGVYTVGVRNLRAHGSIGGEQLSKYLDCGSAPMHLPANSYDVNLSATSYVTPAGQGSTVHTLVSATARDPLSNSPPVECSSTGVFERTVANMLTHGPAQTP